MLWLIQPEQLDAAFVDSARRAAAGSAGHVAIDGKAVRGSANARRSVEIQYASNTTRASQAIGIPQQKRLFTTMEYS